MDGWGIGIFIVGTLIYFLCRKKEHLQGWKTFGAFVAGVGIGIVIAAFWAMSIFNRAFNGIY